MNYTRKLLVILLSRLAKRLIRKPSYTRSERAASKAMRKSFLRSLKISPSYRGSIKSRHEIPIIDKMAIFGSRRLKDFIDHDAIRRVSSFLVSSGSSGTFAFGLKTKAELWHNALRSDIGLEIIFGAWSKKTLLINCLPMGSRVYTQLPASDVGAHSTRALAVIEAAAESFEQLLIIGMGHLFFKRLIEEGETRGLRWNSINAYFLSGGEAFSEGARTYLMSRWEGAVTSLEPPRWSSSGGVTELFLNALFFETPETIRVRRELVTHPKLRRFFLSSDTTAVPMVFAWDPSTSLIEIINEDSNGFGDIVVTNVDRSSLLPLTRYNLRDLGRVITRDVLIEGFSELGRSDLIPQLGFPWILVWGRTPRDGRMDFLELSYQIQDAYYSARDAVGSITGNFRILSEEVAPNEIIEVLFQAKPDASCLNVVKESLAKALESIPKRRFQVEVKRFHEFQFNMDMSFENKFQFYNSANAATRTSN